jgi:hypothetical protein
VTSKLFLKPRLIARIDELKLLKFGWLDGTGIPPTPDGLDWLSEAFDRHFPDDLPLPYLYPRVEGGVRAEWSFKPHELSLDIDLQKRIGHWHALNLEDDAEQTKRIDLAIVSDCEWLNGEVRRLAEANA